MKSFVKTLTLIITMLAAFTCLACKISVDAKDPVTCTVTYKSQRASAPSAIQVKQNTVLTQSQLPELKSKGYIFMGWYDSETKAEPGKYKVKKDVTLTAGWEVDPNYVEYTVEFNSMGGSSVSKQTVEGGHKAKKPQDPAKPDSETKRFIFDNWYTSSDGGNTLSQTPFDFETPINADITLYAKWTITNITYTVTYITKHGTAPQSIVVDKDAILTAEQLPELNAAFCTFKGWFIDDVKVTADYKVTKDITLTASWSVQKFTVTYETDLGTAPQVIQVEATTVLSEAQLPVLTLEGHVFSGWFEGSTKAEPGKYVVTGDVVLIGVWDSDTVTITYVNQNGTTPKPLVLLKNTSLTSQMLPSLTSPDYEFLGWYSNNEEVKVDDLAAANMTLTARWSRNYYTVTFNTKGGGSVDSQTIASGEKAARPDDPTKEAIASESYTFAGWYTSTDGGTTLSSEAFDFDTLIRAPVTLYAKWIKVYTVSFNTMNGSPVSSQIIIDGQTITRPLDPTKESTVSESYNFENWYTSTDNGQTLSSKAFDFNTIITSNITLYAKWTVSTITYTVTFNTMGGSTVTSQTVTGGQKATKPANPTKSATVSESYSFINWYTSTDGGTTLSSTAFDFNTAITSNITLYAKWTATPIKYTVTFNTMGGSTVASQTVPGGQKASRPSNPKKSSTVSESYTFAGWYTSTNGGQTLSSTAYNFNTTITSNITLYAKWTVTPITYIVTFNTMGGSTVASQTVTGEQKASRPSNPTKSATVSESYTFAGWYTSTDAGTTLSSTAFDFNTAITSNITLYAKWTSTPITYTVTFNTMGGSAIESQSVIYGQKATRPTNPTKVATDQETYYFFNWYTSTDEGQTLSDTEYSFNTEITSNITLYAKWINNYEIPLTLEFINSGTITITKPWSTLKYSKNGGTLLACTGNITANAGDKICLYAQESENTNSKYMTINCSSDCYIYGNVMSLVTLNPQTGEWNPYETSVQSYAFYYLFYENNHLINHDEKKVCLPATTLATACYLAMFRRCTSLTTAPALPATTLAAGCYHDMFTGCTSLTTAPDLPATTLAAQCYMGMFSGCTSLTTAPALPATTLDFLCYSGMFQVCTSLTTAPALPATRLAEDCYSYMFSGCTSLTTAPALPATTLAEHCYSHMFSGCTSLTTAPALPATTLAAQCYMNMFSGCTSLTTAPALPATRLAEDCYSYMFSGCTSLTTAPALPATRLAEYCYYNMFSGCTSLTTAPALPATALAKDCYYNMFYGCTNLNHIECLATDISATNCRLGWLYGVSKTGTFIKNKAMTSWPTGTSGIPSGWTVQNAQ